VTSTPLVSILINNYNYGRFLGAAIESALAQSFENIEVIVVDDGSTDGSRDVMASFGPRITSILKKNGGQASAFNAGFVASRGDIICFLDADDLFGPDKVARIVYLFEEHPEIGWCFERVCEFDHETGKRGPARAKSKGVLSDVREVIREGRPPHIPTATSGMSFRRSTLECILPMPEIIRITSDGFLKLVGISLAPGWMNDEELTLQRIHGDNAYTKRFAGKKRLVAKTSLLTGVCLWEKSPHLRRLAITLFSRGLGACCVPAGLDSDCRELAQPFLQQLSPRMKMEVLLRATYSGVRNLVSTA
jgi:glycosyltransferase involved in cell wall biosynthesis